jgi:hypothetical protein
MMIRYQCCQLSYVDKHDLKTVEIGCTCSTDQNQSRTWETEGMAGKYCNGRHVNRLCCYERRDSVMMMMMMHWKRGAVGCRHSTQRTASFRHLVRSTSRPGAYDTDGCLKVCVDGWFITGRWSSLIHVWYDVSDAGSFRLHVTGYHLQPFFKILFIISVKWVANEPDTFWIPVQDANHGSPDALVAHSVQIRIYCCKAKRTKRPGAVPPPCISPSGTALMGQSISELHVIFNT